MLSPATEIHMQHFSFCLQGCSNRGATHFQFKRMQRGSFLPLAMVLSLCHSVSSVGNCLQAIQTWGITSNLFMKRSEMLYVTYVPKVFPQSLHWTFIEWGTQGRRISPAIYVDRVTRQNIIWSFTQDFTQEKSLIVVRNVEKLLLIQVLWKITKNSIWTIKAQHARYVEKCTKWRRTWSATW